ncbi:MAG: serine protein kinase PrkA [Candidatus Nanohaloarchaeota archaeon QJJ-5]|nr:serine protein kinase PrkA [Candidatus Nanohaloarchaeota archaeon QJJ-5]
MTDESPLAYADPSELNEQYQELVPEGEDEMDFFEYLELAQTEDPKVLRDSWQRVSDAIESYGVAEHDDSEYNEFELWTDDPVHDGEYRLIGREIREATGELASKVKSGARGTDTRDRVLVSAGPVGSGKSLADQLLKEGFSEYTKDEEGQMYTFKWTNLSDALDDHDPIDDEMFSPMAQDPVVLLPDEMREAVIAKANETLEEQDPDYEYTMDNKQGPDPLSSFLIDELLDEYDNDFGEVMENHVDVVRYVADEDRRQGIETFEPKDKKNQDETELTGDKNFSKVPVYGDSDPRAFDFSGAFCNANRGIFSGEELLKVQREFLYDFLHAAEEGTIKPKNQPRIDIDQVLFGRTNMPEFESKQEDEKMEAFNDRTEIIKFPYNLGYDAEAEIYGNKIEHADMEDFHIEPHTLEMAGMMAVMTRMEESERVNLIDKAKIYNGEDVGDVNADFDELRDEADEKAPYGREGMEGVSPRFFTNRIDDAIEKVYNDDASSVNARIVLEEIEDGLPDHGSIQDENIDRYLDFVEAVKEEYKSNRAIPDVREALAFDKEELEKVGEKYIDHVLAYNTDDTVEDEVTGQPQEPDTDFLREIEDFAGVPRGEADTFRRDISNWISRYAREENENPEITENNRLREAVEEKLWEDKKHNINYSALVNATDDDTEDSLDSDWIDTLEAKGYSREGAVDVLEFAGAVIAEEELEEEVAG